MAVLDHVRPLQKHVMGIPPEVMMGLKNLRPFSNPKMIALGVSLYERLLQKIEVISSGKVPVEHEQEAADIAGHLIVDAAFIHNCIMRAGYQAGEFPYNHLADKLIPRKKVITDASSA